MTKQTSFQQKVTFDEVLLKTVRERLIRSIERSSMDPIKCNNHFEVSSVVKTSTLFVVTILKHEGVVRKTINNVCLANHMNKSSSNKGTKITIDTLSMYQQEVSRKHSDEQKGHKKSFQKKNSDLNATQPLSPRAKEMFAQERAMLSKILSGAKPKSFSIAVHYTAPQAKEDVAQGVLTIFFQIANDYEITPIINQLKTYEPYRYGILVDGRKITFRKSLKNGDIISDAFSSARVKSVEKFIEGFKGVLIPYLEGIKKFNSKDLRFSKTADELAKEAPFKVEMTIDDFPLAAAISRFVLHNGFKPYRVGMQVSFTVDERRLLETVTWKTDIVDLKKRGIIISKTDGTGKGELKAFKFSFDYDRFKHFPFNRKVDGRHVKRIINSLNKWGVLTVCQVVKTDCIDGVMREYILDGQHRHAGEQASGYPFVYVEVEADDKYAIVEMIADLNNTAKGWTMKVFLDAWCSIKVKDYVYLQEKLKATKLSFAVLMLAYSEIDTRQEATALFKQGKYRVTDYKEGDFILSEVLFFKENYFKRSSAIAGATVKLIRKIGSKKYKREKFAEIFKKHMHELHALKEADLFKRMSELYA